MPDTEARSTTSHSDSQSAQSDLQRSAQTASRPVSTMSACPSRAELELMAADQCQHPVPTPTAASLQTPYDTIMKRFPDSKAGEVASVVELYRKGITIDPDCKSFKIDEDETGNLNLASKLRGLEQGSEIGYQPGLSTLNPGSATQSYFTGRRFPKKAHLSSSDDKHSKVSSGHYEPVSLKSRPHLSETHEET